MPSRQEKLEHSLRCLRALEVLMRHPKLSPEGKKRLGCALRIGKAAVRMRLKVMAASGESGVKRTAGRLPRPDWFPPSPHRAQKKRVISTPGPADLLEEFDRGFSFDERIRQEFTYDQRNAFADMFLGWALHESSDPRHSAWLTGAAEGLLVEADTLGAAAKEE